MFTEGFIQRSDAAIKVGVVKIQGCRQKVVVL